MSMPIWRNSTRAPDFSFFNQSAQAVLRPFFKLIPLEVIKPGLLIRYASCSNQTQSNNCSTLHFKMGSWGHLEFIQWMMTKAGNDCPTSANVSLYRWTPLRQGQNTKKKELSCSSCLGKESVKVWSEHKSACQSRSRRVFKTLNKTQLAKRLPTGTCPDHAQRP